MTHAASTEEEPLDPVEEALLDAIGEACDDLEMAIVIPALMSTLRYVTLQGDRTVRVIAAGQFRDLADELEAIDAPKH